MRLSSNKDLLLFFSLAMCLASCSAKLNPSDRLKDGLLVYYPFSGNTKDKSGNGHHGTNFGATLTKDRKGKAKSSYHFDGINDYIELGNILDDVTYPFTISAWVKQEPHAGPYNCIFTSQDNSDTYNGFEISVNSPTTFGFNTGDGLGSNNSLFRRGKTATIKDRMNIWTHYCAIAISKNDFRLYVNGVHVGGTYEGNSPRPMNSNFPGDVARIGKFSSNNITVHFSGYIDELMIWNRAITKEELQQLVNDSQ